MKTKCDMCQVTSDRKNGGLRTSQSCHLSRVTCHPQDGVALIITLILLGVVTFMAVAFLALSRRERGAVTTVTDTAGARYAADAALANAEAQIIANALIATNPFNFGLLVSTNFVNRSGFQSGVSSYTFTNVSYQYPNGNFVVGNDFLQNLTSLWYSPRPPVFMAGTNFAAGNDFRYYHDLNRNRQFDPNGVVTNYNSLGFVIYDALGLAVTNFRVGDPEWIGVLERPDAPHGPNNKFIARYAYIAVPIGNTLDLNAIHNNARRSTQVTDDDGFFRNQGVGSWEINLAAFLADLNTNVWFQNPATLFAYYDYEPVLPGGPLARFRAFDDALALLNYRYGGSYVNLASVDSLYGAFGFPGNTAFRLDGIDGYSDGPLQTTLNTNADWTVDAPGRPWSGANNTNQYYTHQELFDPARTEMGVTPPGFIEHLLQAGTNTYTGTNVPTYDRYTFYRLLAQLGTDSEPERNKLNLNYRNVTNGIIVPGMETNFYSWTALEFFNNAADRLLRTYTARWRDSNPTNFARTYYAADNFNFEPDQWTNYPAFGLSGAPGVIPGIPVLVSNRFVYTSAVNRLLQLAANLYDATTNNTYEMGRNYPSVFRPLFSRDRDGWGTNVFISGYTNVFSVFDGVNPPLDLPVNIAFLAATNIAVTNFAINVYNVPWIIGAKKGFPNFNEFVVENVVGVSRRLQLSRYTNTSQPTITHTNQMYIMDLSSSLGVDLWNSYNSAYNGTVSGWVRESLALSLTNDDGLPPLSMSFSTNCPISSSSWSGTSPWAGNEPNAASFIVPLGGTFMMLTNSVYRTPTAGLTGGTLPGSWSAPCLVPTNYLGFLGMTVLFETNTFGFRVPHWWLLTTNRLQVYMLDYNNNIYRVIDYAHFEQVSLRDLNAELFTDGADGGSHGVWNTNINTATTLPYGIENQIRVSRRQTPGYENPSPEDGSWRSDPQAVPLGGTIEEQQVAFAAFFTKYGVAAQSPSGLTATNLLSQVQAPYSPWRRLVSYTVLQANDPLVHYLASDMTPSYKLDVTNHVDPGGMLPTLTNLDLGMLNKNYQPWGGSPRFASSNDYNFNLALKDPLVWQSDDWDFPTAKLPAVGWLGRVHRGTSWQSVYLKASAVGLVNWMNWTGDKINSGYDAYNSAPVQDRQLFDVFTTAFNDNATCGTLPVNVGAPDGPSLAAWSALFSGVVALSNNVSDNNLISSGVQHQTSPGYTWWLIQPAGSAGPNSPLWQLANSINQTRARTNLFPMQAFSRVGDILAVTNLTEHSPFLNYSSMAQRTNGISDEMYEWLPQQTMALLRCSSSPRYVIYCYGQTLKPAPNGIYTGGGPYLGMVTNYQVVSETASRAVVRFDSLRTNTFAYWVTNVAGFPATNWYTIPVVTNNNAVIERFNFLPPD
jgi:hypothetical protein